MSLRILSFLILAVLGVTTLGGFFYGQSQYRIGKAEGKAECEAAMAYRVTEAAKQKGKTDAKIDSLEDNDLDALAARFNILRKPEDR